MMTTLLDSGLSPAKVTTAEALAASSRALSLAQERASPAKAPFHPPRNPLSNLPYMTPTQAFNAFRENLPDRVITYVHQQRNWHWFDVVWISKGELKKESYTFYRGLSGDELTARLGTILTIVKAETQTHPPDAYPNPPNAS